MLPDGNSGDGRERVRRQLLRQYVKLQRGLMEADPSSSAYQGAIRAFRQMGYALITAGFEEDLDRLLRIRVLDGGQPRRDTAVARPERLLQEMYVLERRPVFPGS
jgi:hypothetical protein